MSARPPRLWTATIGVSLLGVAIAMGCAQTLLDETWGQSYRETTESMIANPDAGTTEAEPIEGLDPVTAELVIADPEAISAEWRVKEAQIPLERVGQPEEVAAVAVFLAGPGASFMTGQTIDPNGGSVMP